MPETLLKTKLTIPPLRANLISRPHLLERLNQGLRLGRKLTLVSAPAGFGKTTLVSEWVNSFHNDAGLAGENRIAWLSLDDNDNDQARFLSYLIAALNLVDDPEAVIGKGALVMLQSPQPPSTAPILTSLINDMTAVSKRIILVLDDYHLIESSLIDDALAFLLEHLPAQMHLVVTTREDPQLPLPSLRARGQLTELRAADLRFFLPEAVKFLNQVMGLDLSAKEITDLENRTEGWIAGLQLAALALQGTASNQGKTDTTTFIQAFTGSHRFVLDYLVEEVLAQQPDTVRNFLLQTSILEQLTASLCTAVNQQEDSKEILESLERGNLFVVPLDDRRQWYRYHHLFAEVLQAHLMMEQPEQIPVLHRRASEWYEQNDLPSGAIRHALAAEDFERVADLAEMAWPIMEKQSQTMMWLGWVKALPNELIRVRPVLSVGYAWAILGSGSGDLELAGLRLDDAEQWLNKGNQSSKPASGQMMVVNQREFQSLPAAIAVARAYIALALGDVPASITYAQRTLDLLPDRNYRWYGVAVALLGFAYWGNGDLDEAFRTFADFRTIMQKAGDIVGAIGGTSMLADIRVTQGRLQEAVRIYEQSLQLASAQRGSLIRGTAEIYVGLGELYCEQGDFAMAAQYLQQSAALGEPATLLGNEYRLYPVIARIKEALGDMDGALELLDEAERLQYRTPVPDVRPIAAMKARVWIRQGRLAEAQGWVRERGLSLDDDANYLQEFEHITLARALIAQHRSQPGTGAVHEVIELLTRLLKAAETGKRMGSAIEILMLQALAHEMIGDMSAALEFLDQSLTLAMPQGYGLIFIEEGPPMVVLLREAEKQGVSPNYVGQLLKAFAQGSGDTAVNQSLIEPLSEREIDVLKLLNTELNGPEIARELMVSINTLRTHTKNIYSKLGVNNRRSAVRRAEELNLL